MSRYGFKVLKAEVHKWKGRKGPLDWANPAGTKTKPVSYLKLLTADIDAVIAEQEARNSPSVEDATSATLEDGTIEITSDDIVREPTGEIPTDETSRTLEEGAIEIDDVVTEGAISDSTSGASKPRSVVRVDKITKLHSALLLEVYYGSVGDHVKGIDPDGVDPDYDLSKIATTRVYRALIIAPVAGDNGFLAVEVISRSHVSKALPSRLYNSRIDHSFTLKTLGPVADDDSVADLVNNPRLSKVELYKSVVAEDSEHADTFKATLSFNIGKASKEEKKLIERAKTWVPTRANREKEKRPEPSEEATAIVSYLWPSLEGEKFDDAMMVLEKNGRTKRLQPLDMAEGFTYDIGEASPDNDVFVARVAEVVDRLSITDNVDLDPDWALPNDSASG